MKLVCATGDQADRTVKSANNIARGEAILKNLLGRENQSMRMPMDQGSSSSWSGLIFQ